jgi:hypothetical protein
VKYYEYKVVFRNVIEEKMAGLALAFGVANVNDLPEDTSNGFPYPTTEKQAAINRAYSWNREFTQQTETIASKEIYNRCEAIFDNGDRRCGGTVPDIKQIGVMIWILYYVSMIQQEKALKKRKYNLLRVMYGFSIISILISYNHLDRFLGTMWRLVIPLLISVLIELGLYYLRRPVKRKTIDETSYKMRTEDYVFDRILYSYLVRYGICFLVIAVILAEPIGRLSAKAKCDYQICFYDDKTFAVILEYDERVLVQQATNKEYEEWQKYKEEKAKGHILMPDTLRFICAANSYDPTKIGQHFLEVLPKVCPPEEEHKLHL